MKESYHARQEDQPEVIETFAFPIDATHEVACSRVDLKQDSYQIINRIATSDAGLELTESSFPIIGQVDPDNPFHFYVGTYWADARQDGSQAVIYRSAELFIQENGSITSTESKDTEDPYEAFQLMSQGPSFDSDTVAVIICPKGSFKMGISIRNTALPSETLQLTEGTPTPRDFAVLDALGFPTQ